MTQTMEKAWIISQNKNGVGTSLVVQWVNIRVPNAGSPGSIPGRGTGSHLHAATASSRAATKMRSSLNK